MLTLIKQEIYKIFTKPRTYIGFLAVAFIVLAVNLGFYFEGEQLLDFLISELKDKFLFQGKLINGYTITFVILSALWIHMPLLVSLVAGDLIAGEANGGTFRLLLTRPISRTKLLFAKFFAGWLYAITLVIFLVGFSLLMGSFLFGFGDLIVIKSTITIFAEDDILWRFGYASLYGMLTMTMVTALSFFLSAFSDNSVGPIVGTFAIIIGLTIVSTIGYVIVKPILPYLFTTYLRSWNLFFEMNIDYEKLTNAILTNIAYIFAFTGIAFYYFKNKDILS